MVSSHWPSYGRNVCCQCAECLKTPVLASELGNPEPRHSERRFLLACCSQGAGNLLLDLWFSEVLLCARARGFKRGPLTIRQRRLQQIAAARHGNTSGSGHLQHAERPKHFEQPVDFVHGSGEDRKSVV